MSKTIKAVTVTKDYLNRKIWVVKLLSVFNRKDGTPYWYVKQTIDSDPDKITMQHRAVHYAIEKRVAYIFGIKHGHNLTENHKAILHVYERLRK